MYALCELGRPSAFLILSLWGLKRGSSHSVIREPLSPPHKLLDMGDRSLSPRSGFSFLVPMATSSPVHLTCPFFSFVQHHYIFHEVYLPELYMAHTWFASFIHSIHLLLTHSANCNCVFITTKCQVLNKELGCSWEWYPEACFPEPEGGLSNWCLLGVIKVSPSSLGGSEGSNPCVGEAWAKSLTASLGPPRVKSSDGPCSLTGVLQSVYICLSFSYSNLSTLGMPLFILPRKC